MNKVALKKALRKKAPSKKAAWIPLAQLNQQRRPGFIAPALTLLLAMGTTVANGASDATTDGEALFRANCAECHQLSGQGIANVYPALAGSETVLGSGLDVALVMIIGRGEMPSFSGVLDSTEMAAIINYVRSSWGNSGTPVSAEAIEQLQ